MGWGLLFFGYFLEFVLGMNSMFAPFVHVIGYALMAVGINGLRRYCRSFGRAYICALVLLLLGIWRMFVGVDEMFSLQLPFLLDGITQTVNWADFAVMILFHVFLALSVKELALRVSVSKNAVRAMRNLIAFALYAGCYLLLSIVPALKVLIPVTLLLRLFWAICNCVMLYSCYMHIAPANEHEERPPSRFAFVNRMRAAFAAREQKAIEADRVYHAEHARRAHDNKMARLSRKQQAREQARERNKKD
jgi:hypothetical protein